MTLAGAESGFAAGLLDGRVAVIRLADTESQQMSPVWSSFSPAP